MVVKHDFYLKAELMLFSAMVREMELEFSEAACLSPDTVADDITEPFEPDPPLSQCSVAYIDQYDFSWLDVITGNFTFRVLTTVKEPELRVFFNYFHKRSREAKGRYSQILRAPAKVVSTKDREDYFIYHLRVAE